MNKSILKDTKRTEQKKKCAISKERLPAKVALYDAHRILSKAKGGKLSHKNVEAVNPVPHMKFHDIFVERSESMKELKILVDGRMQIRKLVNSFSNRLTAKKRETDDMDPETKEWLEAKLEETKTQLAKTDKRVVKYLLSLNLPIVQAALAIKGLGPITVAFLLIYIRIDRAEHASSLWKYCGYDKPACERYTKGEAGGGNKTLRTALYAMGESMIKTRCIYRDVYDAEKLKLSLSENMVMDMPVEGHGMKLTMWKDVSKGHRHAAAIRKMNKHFLADFWFVYRTLSGLPTNPLYVEAQLGHKGIVRPEERGWIY